MSFCASARLSSYGGGIALDSLDENGVECNEILYASIIAKF